MELFEYMRLFKVVRLSKIDLGGGGVIWVLLGIFFLKKLNFVPKTVILAKNGHFLRDFFFSKN